jgi:hypothetical protein
METRLAIVGVRRSDGKLAVISGPEVPHREQEEKFMPFRLNRENAEYSETHLCEVISVRTERHEVPKADAVSTTKGKSAMKSIKNMLALIAFMALAFTAHAQSYNQGSILGGTANSPASTDNTTYYTTNSTVIPCTKATEIALQLEHKLQGAGTSAVVARFDESVDGITWTASTRLMTNTSAGTTLVSKTQTFTVGAVGYIRLASINNSSATAVTNLIVKYAFKTP